MRVVVGVARIEALLLTRSALLLVGLIAGTGLVWQFAGDHQALWWVVDWQIGHGQMILSATALVAGQLLAGRVRRSGMTGLYESLPTPASSRTGGQLAGLAGVLPASALLIAVVVVFTQLRTPIGSPGAATLAAGVLLVVAGGAIGVAIGTRLSHPLAGVVAALAWLAIYGQSNQFNGTSAWLFPWLRPGQLESLSHPVNNYPPAIAHALELAGIAVLAATVALALVAGNARAHIRAALVGVVAAAGICGTAAVQLRPVPTSAVDRLVAEAADPASAQQCTTTSHVRYCLYPGFGSLLPALRAPIDAVIAQLPSLPAQRLTVRQVSTIFAEDTSLTAGHSAQQIARWNAQLQAAPQNTPSASDLYVPVGAWPAGSRLAAARFDLALGTAVWAVGLPPSIAAPVNPGGPGAAPAQCVALDQAREAVAIYLALQATHPATGPANPRHGMDAFVVDGNAVVAWRYPGGDFSQYVIPSGLALTDQGYLLAEAMTRLPAGKVGQVLRSAWSTWLDRQTTDSQLADALGIPLPTTPSLLPPPRQPSGQGGPNAPPQNPRCT